MIPEKHFLNQIEQAFSHLITQKIYLLDVEGNILLPSEEEGKKVNLPENREKRDIQMARSNLSG